MNEQWLNELARRKVCPRCGKEGYGFVSQSDFVAFQCIFCKLAWKSYDEGYWERIIGQDEKTWMAITDGSLVVMNEVAL